MSKFKVGDKVFLNDYDENPICTIVGYYEDRYLINTELSSVCNYVEIKNSTANYREVIPFDGYSWVMSENNLDPAYKDIKDTKIARKLNKEYEVLENGMLRIRL